MASDPITQTAARGSDAFVMIACKHPNGVVLNLDHYELMNVQNNRVQRRVGKASVTLKGWAHAINKPDPTEGTGGYVLTRVPADFWEAWLATHQDFPMIEDGTILGPHKDAPGQARSYANVPKMHAPTVDEVKDLEAAKFNPKD